MCFILTCPIVISHMTQTYQCHFKHGSTVKDARPLCLTTFVFHRSNNTEFDSIHCNGYSIVRLWTVEHF